MAFRRLKNGATVMNTDNYWFNEHDGITDSSGVEYASFTSTATKTRQGVDYAASNANTAYKNGSGVRVRTDSRTCYTAQGGACNSSNQVAATGVFTPSVPNQSYYATGKDRYNSQLHFNAAYSSDRYGSYAEVNPLYESCTFWTFASFSYSRNGALEVQAVNNNCNVTAGVNWGGQAVNFNASWYYNRYGNYGEVRPLYSSCQITTGRNNQEHIASLAELSIDEPEQSEEDEVE